jgi:hypothetical protein
MDADEPRWFYVGNGQLRLKNGEDWTDEYQTIETRRTRASQPAAVAEPESQQPLAGTRTRGRALLWLLVCAAIVVAGGTGTAFAKDALKPGGLLSAASAFPATAVVAPAKAAKAATKPGPVRGVAYKKADYLKHTGAIPVRVADVRKDSGSELATRVSLMSLGLQYEAVGSLPAPPKVDAKWWAASTKTLSELSLQAADEWADGEHKTAMAHFESIIKRSNTLVTKVNAACGLRSARRFRGRHRQEAARRLSRMPPRR